MRPYLEKRMPEPESSISLLNRRLEGAIPFLWHHHPEYELTLTLNSAGQRFIGDHVGAYGPGDLVLVGPNLPHSWASHAKISESEPHVALVVWFHPQWLAAVAQSLIEFRAVADLAARAGRGLQFSAAAAQAAAGEVAALFTLAPAERVLALLRLLNRLARDGQAQPLASAAVADEPVGEGAGRIGRVLTYVHARYASGVRLPELADVAALSVSGLHRLFYKHTRTSLSAYLMQLRIGDACARLSGTDQPVAAVAEAVGYNSLANFNRQFKALRGRTPREYRGLYQRAARLTHGFLEKANRQHRLKEDSL